MFLALKPGSFRASEAIPLTSSELWGESSSRMLTCVVFAGGQQGLGSQWEHPLPWWRNSHWCAWALQPRVQVLCLLGTQGKSLLHAKLYLRHVSMRPSCWVLCASGPETGRACHRCAQPQRRLLPWNTQGPPAQGFTVLTWNSECRQHHPLAWAGKEMESALKRRKATEMLYLVVAVSRWLFCPLLSHSGKLRGVLFEMIVKIEITLHNGGWGMLSWCERKEETPKRRTHTRSRCFKRPIKPDEWSSDKCCDMVEPWKHYAKYKKPVVKDHLHELSSTAKFLKTKCRSVVAQSWGQWGELGLNACWKWRSFLKMW